MQIFVFFLYNRAGNKTDENCAQNVLTEARVSGLRASVLRTLDGQVRLSFLPSFAQPRLAPAGTPGSLSSPLLSSLLSSWVGLRSGPRRSGPRIMRKVQKARSLQTASATPRDSALPPSSLEKSCSGTSHPLVCLWLCSSLGGGAGARRSRLGQGPLPARAPSRRPRPARPSSLSSSQTGQGWGRGRDRTRGSPGLGTRDGESGPGQGRGPGPATTHRKNSGEEGLSLVEPASLKPELASFSHLTL